MNVPFFDRKPIPHGQRKSIILKTYRNSEQNEEPHVFAHKSNAINNKLFINERMKIFHFVVFMLTCIQEYRQEQNMRKTRNRSSHNKFIERQQQRQRHTKQIRKIGSIPFMFFCTQKKK